MALSWSRVERQTGRLVTGIIAGLAFVWAPLEPLKEVLPFPLWLLRALIPGGALMYALWKLIPRNKIDLRGPNNLRVQVAFGDLFDQKDANLAIGADDFFLTRHDKLITPRALISLLHQRRFGSMDDLDFDRMIADATHVLDEYTEHPAKEIRSRLDDRTRQFPVGSTLVVTGPMEQYFVVAVCRIDLGTVPPSGKATAAELFQALLGLWSTVRRYPKGKAVAVPLLGTGQSGTGLQPAEALHLMLASLVCASRTGPIPDDIRIVLHESYRNSVDLDGDVLAGLVHA